MYGYTPEQISNMTPYQQVMLLEDKDDSGNLRFKTEAEYLKWMSERRM